MRLKFTDTGPIPVSEILLDQNNYRLGILDNQLECIEAMFKEFGDKMAKIASHIAQNGLSPRPIIVYKDTQGRWVVRDGNRRITALKLLNNPSEAPDQYQRAFRSIISKAVPGNIPVSINCLTADEATINKYRILEHMGPQDGVGQVDWDARAKDNMQADMDGKLQYPIARAVCGYLDKKGFSEARTVSISNMQRLLEDSNARKRLGILWDGQEFAFTAKEDEVVNILKEIVDDFLKRDKTVKDIYLEKDRVKYLNEFFRTRGFREPTPISSPVYPDGKSPKSLPKIPAKTQPPWDRKRVIQKGAGISVPVAESKLNAILVELASRLDVREATIASAILVRLVLERSVECYAKNNSVTFAAKKQYLYQHIVIVANHMKQARKINENQFRKLAKMSNFAEFISAHTLNAWVHDPDYSPSPREVCMFWDNIYFFLVKCWE